MSEAANPEGADARSPWALSVDGLWTALGKTLGNDCGHVDSFAGNPGRWPLHCCVDCASRAIEAACRAAESRGAKARDARIEALEGALRGEIWNAVNRRRQNLLAIGLPIHPAAKQMLDEVEVFVQAAIQRVLPLGTDAQRPSGSPSVPAAQPKDQANHMAAAQAVEHRGEACACGAVRDLCAKIASHATLDGVMHTTSGCAPGRPRAAPSDSAPATPGLLKYAREGLWKAQIRIGILLDRMRGCDAEVREGTRSNTTGHELSLFEGEGWIDEHRGQLAKLDAAIAGGTALCPGCDCIRGRCDCAGCPDAPAPATPGLGPTSAGSTEQLGACGKLATPHLPGWYCHDWTALASGEPRVAPSSPEPAAPRMAEADQHMLVADDGRAICLDKQNPMYGWIFWKHPDGQWVSERPALPSEIERAERKADLEAVSGGTQEGLEAAAPPHSPEEIRQEAIRDCADVARNTGREYERDKRRAKLAGDNEETIFLDGMVKAAARIAGKLDELVTPQKPAPPERIEDDIQF